MVTVDIDIFCSETDAIMENEPLDELLKQVDTLFTGSSEDKTLAYQILHERRNKVTFVKLRISSFFLINFKLLCNAWHLKSISSGFDITRNKSLASFPYNQI